MDMYPMAVPLNAHASIVQVYVYTCRQAGLGIQVTLLSHYLYLFPAYSVHAHVHVLSCLGE